MIFSGKDVRYFVKRVTSRARLIIADHKFKVSREMIYEDNSFDVLNILLALKLDVNDAFFG